MRKIVCVILLAISSAAVFAQTNAGKDFWVVQTPNLNTSRVNTAQFAISVANGGKVTASITITNPARPTINVDIPAGSLQTFTFATENANILSTGTYTNNVYHVTSNNYVVVYSFNPLLNVVSNDAALILPTHALGKKHFVASYVHALGSAQNSFYGVVATEDGTTIKSYNNSGVLVDNVVLNKGQYFQRMNGNTLSADVTGWAVEGNKPISVISGSQGTGVGNSNGASDHLDEQILPVETLASTYVAAPTNSRPIGCTGPNCAQDVFRYVATEDNTVITTIPNLGGGTINKGQYIEITTSTPHVVSGTHPFYGFQYLVSQNSGTPVAGTGDPSLIAMPLLDQLQYHYVYLVPTSFPFNFINVMAPAGVNITIDGVTVTPTWLTAGTVNGITYRTAVIATTPGVHDIVGDKKFGILVSGFGATASYAYMGGSGLEPINAGCITGGPYQAYSCSNNPAVVQLNGKPTCSDGSAPSSVRWTSSDGVVFSDATIANPVATVPGPGTYSITMTVRCDTNVVSCTSEIIVREPFGGCGAIGSLSITAPPDKTINADQGQSYASNVATGTATYIAQGAATLSNNAPAKFPIGSTTVTWTVSDSYNRTASATQVITVVDAEIPTISAPPNILIYTDPGQNTASGVDIGTATFHDNSGTAIVSNDGLQQYPLGNTTVTWKVVDAAGNSAAATQVVTVVPRPSLVAPADITVNNDNGVTYATGITLGNAIYSAYGPETLSNNAPARYPLGTTVVTWTLTDALGTTVIATQNVTIIAPPPAITAPDAITVTADYSGFATVAIGTATYTTSVDPASLANDAPAQFPIGTTTVNWTVTDGLGRTASATQVITVLAPPPVIGDLGDITAGNDPGMPWWTIASLSAPDVLAVGPYTLTSNAPARFPVGTTIITWTLTDKFGVTVTGTQKVTVIAPPPTVTAPPAITVMAGYNGFATGLITGTATYTTSVDPASLSKNEPSQYPVGNTTITWTVTDGLNRTASATQVITVAAPKPVIAPPADITVNNNAGVAYATGINLGTPLFSAVGPYTLTNNAPAQFPVGETIVTWTLTDAYGNKVTTTQKVTVAAPPPTIIAPPAVTVMAGYNGFATGVATSTATYTTSVDPASLSNNAPAQYPVGNTTITWTVTDGLNRTASATQVITVAAPKPVIAPPADITVNNNAGVAYATGINLGTPLFSAVGPYTLTNNAPAQFPVGETIVTWTLTDAYGNKVTTTQKVTITAPLPTIIAPPAITVNANPGQNYATGVALGNATYTVSVNNAVLTNNAPAQFPVGTTTVTWTVKDGLGRTATATQQVTVKSGACQFNSSITSIPTDNTPTGGNPNNLYIGYGAQSTKLQANVPNTGGSYTFQWNNGNGLSNATSAAPIFTPPVAGTYTFTVNVKNNTSGCASTSAITICVRDVRSLDKNGNWDGKKVIVCHLPPGNTPNVQYIDVSINAVPTHVPNHGGDGLGNSCVQPSCASPYARSVVTMPALETFAVSVYPNPAPGAFALTVRSEDKFTRVTVRIVDAFGRTLETKNEVPVGRTIFFGERYASGTYYAEVIQGEDRKVIPLIKAK